MPVVNLARLECTRDVQVAWLIYFAAFVSLVAALFCAVMMARIDITEYACCTKDVPEGSAELDQKQGPVCFRNAAFCDDIANDCLAVGMPSHPPFLFPCLFHASVQTCVL